MFKTLKTVLGNTVSDVNNNHTLAFAAGLSYYFLLGLFPMLIALAAIVGYLPLHDPFGQILNLLSQYVPADSMGLVRQVARDVISPSKGKLLSFGLLASLWAASTGFAGMIEALDVAYDVPETRPFWMTRLLAIGMVFGVGTLLILALGVIVVGPQFGAWLADTLHLHSVLRDVWPALRWTVSVAFTIIGVELLYLWGPNIRQQFRHSLPGAALAVLAWLLLSNLLGIYFQRFAHFNKTYGALGGAIALMTWLYWSAFTILLGAEVNSELIKVRSGRLPLRYPLPEPEKRRPAAEGELAA
jgi:membrane protein